VAASRPGDPAGAAGDGGGDAGGADAGDDGGGTDAGPWLIFREQADESKVIDPNNHRPLLGVGDTFLVGGSWYNHPGLDYMDSHGLTKVRIGTDGQGTSWIRLIGTTTDIVNVPTASLTAIHDYFILELAVEPAGGTLVLAATGMLSPGTTAAGYYAATETIPKRSTYTDAWYVYQWDDTDSSGGPSAGDTFTQKGHGK
jgi:hypothetical protein